MVTIKTKFGSTLKMPRSKIMKQVKELYDNAERLFVILKGGQRLEVGSLVDSIECEVKDLKRERRNILDVEPIQEIEYKERKLLDPKDCPSVVTAFCVKGKAPRPDTDKCTGEMVWTHKTSPEIVIRDKDGNIKKDVDYSKMYRRR